jgi:4-amino-4-deoxy-L-arabinose transferase-like glycosyltransferase
MHTALVPGTPGQLDRDVSKRAALAVVAVLVVASFAIRMWALETAVASGTFAAIDADSYLKNARTLAQDGQGWRWTNRAVEYPWAGQMYYLPPLYPVFLSFFVLLFDAFQYWAAVGQIAINALSVAGLYVIASSLHSRRAGIIAALIYTCWLSSIWRFGIFIQEQLYLPLLIAAFALLVRAMSRAAAPSSFAVAGVVFGLATLTRSMPLYFMLPAAVGYVLAVRDREAVRRASALLAGFLLVTGAYSVFISYQLNRVMFIENHAGISIELYGVEKNGVPGHDDIVVQLLGALWRDPAGFIGTWWGYVRALFHVPGDRWLHAYMASSADGAAVAKFFAHAGIDLPFVLCVVLAPLGAVFARRRGEATLLVLWVLIVVSLTALSATGGVRYRSPFEPSVIALASIVLAGSWQRPRLAGLLIGLAGTALAGSLVLAQIPRVATARANYGVPRWGGAEVSWRAWTPGAAGFNLLPNGSGSLELQLVADGVAGPVRASIRVDGYPITERTVTADPARIRLAPRHRGFHFIEVTATDAAGKPAPLGIEVWR